MSSERREATGAMHAFEKIKRGEDIDTVTEEKEKTTHHYGDGDEFDYHVLGIPENTGRETMSRSLVSPEDLAAFLSDGAVCLRRVFSEKFVDLIRQGIAYNREHPSDNTKRKGNHSPLFFSDYDNWEHVEQFKEFVFQSPAARIASAVLDSKKVAHFLNHVIVKDSGCTRVTPWHQDLAYYGIQGQQVCSIWLPVDPVTTENCLRLIKGSHKWPHLYVPVHFDGVPPRKYSVKPEQQADAQQYLPVPETDQSSGEVLSWNMEPGDCIVFHMRTIHGAPENALPSPRRAFSTRWVGDDVIKAERPWVNLPPNQRNEALKVGDNLVASGVFPVVHGAE